MTVSVTKNLQVIGNKAKGRISKRVFQESKACQNFRKTNISYLLIRTRMPFCLIPDEIEHLVALELGSDHIPPHYLCNAHTYEKLDEALLSVLTSVEKEISLREKLESSYLQLKVFYRGRKSIVECALVTFCKLITPDTSAKSSSLSDEFNIIIESEGRVKLAPMYQQRRFNKLGTTAACVIKSIDLYNELLEQTSKRNLLVKACRLYLNCEFICVHLNV